MATANELLLSACQSGIACLDRHDLLVVTAEALNGSEMAHNVLQNACANGFDCLNERELLVVIAQALND